MRLWVSKHRKIRVIEGVRMIKELSELTLEELWQLFPIVLKDYNQAYPSRKIEMATLMRRQHLSRNIQRWQNAS